MSKKLDNLKQSLRNHDADTVDGLMDKETLSDVSDVNEKTIQRWDSKNKIAHIWHNGHKVYCLPEEREKYAEFESMENRINSVRDTLRRRYLREPIQEEIAGECGIPHDNEEFRSAYYNLRKKNGWRPEELTKKHKAFLQEVIGNALLLCRGWNKRYQRTDTGRGSLIDAGWYRGSDSEKSTKEFWENGDLVWSEDKIIEQAKQYRRNNGELLEKFDVTPTKTQTITVTSESGETEEIHVPKRARVRVPREMERYLMDKEFYITCSPPPVQKANSESST